MRSSIAVANDFRGKDFGPASSMVMRRERCLYEGAGGKR